MKLERLSLRFESWGFRSRGSLPFHSPDKLLLAERRISEAELNNTKTLTCRRPHLEPKQLNMAPCENVSSADESFWRDFFVGNWSKLPFIRAFGHPEMTQSPLEQRAVELSENVTLLEVQDGSDTNQLQGKQRALEDLPAVNDRRGKVCTRCRTSDYERTNCKKTPCNDVNSCKLKDKHPESLTEIGT
ncbi:unnamed protein product [Pocillopora meandrina]|uniref:Uncharacterized protein n=1 Tax=Pocillopora meandrina TaxID=46732 RepID=A0AAU9Y1E5_9CNID|nr:unnamed protein product [Pocillopora meandrina]